MSRITVRAAGPADAAFIAAGNAAMALETEHLTLDAARLAAGVESLLADPAKGFYLVAECAGVPAGQMMITYEWSDWRDATFWWIQSVYVLPEFRSRGVFRALYRHVEQRAREDSAICGLRLYVESDNQRAQRTYLGVGMRQAPYAMFEVDYVLDRREKP
jgi:GNAT superfamily N-acetyltransferase